MCYWFGVSVNYLWYHTGHDRTKKCCGVWVGPVGEKMTVLQYQLPMLVRKGQLKKMDVKVHLAEMDFKIHLDLVRMIFTDSYIGARSILARWTF